MTEIERTPWGQHSILHLVLFIMGAEVFLLSPLVPAIARSLDAPMVSIAAAATVFGVTYAVTSPVFGAISARFPRKSVIVAGLLILLAGVTLSLASNSVGTLLVARAVTGVGGAVTGPAVWSYLSSVVAAPERARAASRGAAAYAAGQIAGVPIGVLLAAGSSQWRAAYGVVAVGLACIIGVVIAKFDDNEPARDRTAQVGQLFRSSAQVLRLPLVSWILVGNAAAAAARLGSYAYAGAFLASRFHLPTVVLGLVGSVAGAGAFAGALLAGPTIDRWRASGRYESSIAGWAATMLAVFVAMWWTAPSAAVAVAAIVLAFAAGSWFFSASQVTLVSSLGAKRAEGVSWNNSFQYVGNALGTAILGLTAVGSLPFAAIAVGFAIAASLIALRIRRVLQGQVSIPT